MRKNQERNSQSVNRIENQIGAQLRQARLVHHYSLEKVYNDTKIQVKYLVDIDKGALSKLPGDFYIRAFVKKYANDVGLNGAELLKSYNNKLPDPQDPHYMSNISKNRLLEKMKTRSRLEKQVAIRQYIPIATIIIIIFVILISGWLVAIYHHPSINTYNHSTVSLSGVLSHKVNQHHSNHRRLLKALSIKGNKIVYKVPLNGKNRIMLYSISRSKIMIKNHRHSILNTSLKPHQKKSILIHSKDNRQLLVKLTNYPKIRIIINNRLLQKQSKIKNPTIILK